MADSEARRRRATQRPEPEAAPPAGRSAPARKRATPTTAAGGKKASAARRPSKAAAPDEIALPRKRTPPTPRAIKKAAAVPARPPRVAKKSAATPARAPRAPRARRTPPPELVTEDQVIEELEGEESPAEEHAAVVAEAVGDAFSEPEPEQRPRPARKPRKRAAAPVMDSGPEPEPSPDDVRAALRARLAEAAARTSGRMPPEAAPPRFEPPPAEAEPEDVEEAPEPDEEFPAPAPRPSRASKAARTTKATKKAARAARPARTRGGPLLGAAVEDMDATTQLDAPPPAPEPDPEPEPAVTAATWEPTISTPPPQDAAQPTATIPPVGRAAPTPPPTPPAPPTPPKQGRKLRTVGIVAAVAVVAAIVLVGGALLLGNVLGEDGVNYAELQPGQCFDRPSGRFNNVETVPCTEEHDLEVYAVLDHPAPPGDAFPGMDELLRYASPLCLSQFADYAGVPFEQLSLRDVYITPRESAWNDDARRVVCAVGTIDEQPTNTAVKAGG